MFFDKFILHEWLKEYYPHGLKHFATDTQAFCSDRQGFAIVLYQNFLERLQVLLGVGPIDRPRLLSLAYFGISASMVYPWLLRDIWMLHLFAFSYGVFHGVRISAGVGVLPEIFGMRYLGELIGIRSAAGTLISALAPYAAGALFDATGSYSLSFLSVVLLMAAGAVVAGLVKRIAARTERP